MRPLEMLLVVANLITFVVLAVPRLRAIPWTGSIVLIALPVFHFPRPGGPYDIGTVGIVNLGTELNTMLE